LKNIKGKSDELGDVSHLFKRKAKETKDETKAVSSKVSIIGVNSFLVSIKLIVNRLVFFSLFFGFSLVL
jgi:hypothetical protein